MTRVLVVAPLACLLGCSTSVNVIEPPSDAAVPTDGALPDGALPDADPGNACTASYRGALPPGGGSVSGTLMGTGVYPVAGCTLGSAPTLGPEDVWGLSLDAPGIVSVSVAAGSADVVLAVRRICDDATSEVACADGALDGSAESVRVALDAGFYFVVVDRTESDGPAPYTLTWSVDPVSDNATCGGAIELTDGVRRLDDARGTELSAFPCEGFPVPVDWRTLYYRAVLAPGDRLRVDATPVDPAVAVHVAILPSCEASTCLGLGPGGATVRNRGTEDLDVIVVVLVGDTSFATPESYAVDVQATLGPAPDPGVCTDATFVEPGAVVEGFTGDGTPGLACTSVLGPLSDYSVYYRTTVPAGATLRAQTGGLAPGLLQLAFAPSCDDELCLAEAREGELGTSWTNATGSDRDVWIAVFSQEVVVPFTLQLTSSESTPAHRDCASALPVTSGTIVTAQSTAAGVDDLSGLCLPAATSPVLYYRASVPAGSILTAGMEPFGTFGAAVRILDGCAATSCLAASQAATAIGSAATFSNVGLSPRDVIVAASATAPVDDLFEVLFDIRPAAYAIGTTATDCEDLTGEVTLPGIDESGTISPVLPLPFPFSYFDEAVTHFAAASSGYVQLFDRPDAMPLSRPYNSPIPSPSDPDGVVAAYWDDLRNTGVTRPASVRVASRGVAPSRRLIVEWQDWLSPGDLSTEARLLTFQVKLFEDGAIEMHYCAIEGSFPGMAATSAGGSATVGIEALGGIAGVQHAFDTDASVRVTEALRFE